MTEKRRGEKMRREEWKNGKELSSIQNYSVKTTKNLIFPVVTLKNLIIVRKSAGSSKTNTARSQKSLCPRSSRFRAEIVFP